MIIPSFFIFVNIVDFYSCYAIIYIGVNMNKQQQLIKFGTVLKTRRQALKLSLREVEKLSDVSAALITKLENGKMPNFPKAITIKQLSDALKFNDELFILADILFEPKQVKEPENSFEDELRKLLATKTTLNSENITQVLYFVLGLEKLQRIENL